MTELYKMEDNRNINTSPIEVCECGNKVWLNGFILKRISKLLTKSGDDEMMPIPIFYCSKCGELAPFLKNDPKFKEFIQ